MENMIVTALKANLTDVDRNKLLLVFRQKMLEIINEYIPEPRAPSLTEQLMAMCSDAYVVGLQDAKVAYEHVITYGFTKSKVEQSQDQASG